MAKSSRKFSDLVTPHSVPVCIYGNYTGSIGQSVDDSSKGPKLEELNRDKNQRQNKSYECGYGIGTEASVGREVRKNRPHFCPSTLSASKAIVKAHQTID